MFHCYTCCRFLQGVVGSWIYTVLTFCPYINLRFAIHVVWCVLRGLKGSLSSLPLLQSIEVHEPPQCWLRVQSPHRRPLISFWINKRLIHLCDVLIFISPFWGQFTVLCSFTGLGICPPGFNVFFFFFLIIFMSI